MCLLCLHNCPQNIFVWGLNQDQDVRAPEDPSRNWICLKNPGIDSGGDPGLLNNPAAKRLENPVRSGQALEFIG